MPASGTATERFECAIVGGGPAGSALAWLLAGRGQAVLLLDDGRHTGPAPTETLLASARGGLDRAGLLPLLEAAAVPDPLRHGAIWGSDTLRWRDEGGGGPGWLLRRGPFDAALRAEAARRGATVVHGASVCGPLPPTGRGVIVWTDRDGRRGQASADAFVVATGRRARADLLATRSVQRGEETAALTLQATHPGFANAAVVEAVPQGWWWWSGDGAEGGHAVLLADVDELTRRGTRALLWAARAAALGPVAGAQHVRLVHATRATARELRTTAEILLLGDAAATIDPLASQGVEKAFAAAEHAAAVLTCRRRRPEWWPRLLHAHARWERGLFAAHRQVAAQHLGNETRFVTAPFWQRRRTALPPPAAPFAGLLCRHPQVSLAKVLRRIGDDFEEVDGAVHAQRDEHLTHVGYVPAAAVLARFDGPCTAATAARLAGADARLFVLPPAAIAGAIEQLRQLGWLTPVPEPGPPDIR